MAKRWILHDGMCREWPDDLGDLPEGAVETNAPPKRYGRLVDGRWEDDHEAIADADHGGERQKEAEHRDKRIEAALILSGYALTHGFLAEESKALRVPLEQLAQTVYDKSSELRATALKRRKAKEKARG